MAAIICASGQRRFAELILLKLIKWTVFFFNEFYRCRGNTVTMCKFHESTCKGFGDIWWTDNPIYFSSKDELRHISPAVQMQKTVQLSFTRWKLSFTHLQLSFTQLQLQLAALHAFPSAQQWQMIALIGSGRPGGPLSMLRQVIPSRGGSYSSASAAV